MPPKTNPNTAVQLPNRRRLLQQILALCDAQIDKLAEGNLDQQLHVLESIRGLILSQRAQTKAFLEAFRRDITADADRIRATCDQWAVCNTDGLEPTETSEKEVELVLDFTQEEIKSLTRLANEEGLTTQEYVRKKLIEDYAEGKAKK